MAALVQIMAGCRSGDKSLSEAMMVCSTNAYMRHPASVSHLLEMKLGLNQTA